MKFENRHISIAGSLVLSGLIAFVAFEAHKKLDAKVKAQKAITTQASGFKDRISELKPFEERWMSSFRPLTKDFDILEIYRSIKLDDLAPFTPDEMRVTAIKQEDIAGTLVPLYRMCITNSLDSFQIREATVSAAMEKVTQLAARPDVRIKRIDIKPEAGALKISVDSVCVLLRT